MAQATSTAERVFLAQSRLKKDILDARGDLSPQARDLAALMLLELTDPTACWTAAVSRLKDILRVERVDGGFGDPRAPQYEAGVFEAREEDVPTIKGLFVDNQDPSARYIWCRARPVVHDDIENHSLFEGSLRDWFLANGVRTKVTTSLYWLNKPVGLICADRLTRSRGWQSGQLIDFDTITRSVIAPIIGTARDLAEEEPASLPEITATTRLMNLTPMEMQVCQLVAAGFSYKEMAQRLDRSFSTVDHHLRNIRKKLGTNTTGKLQSFLAEGVVGRRRAP